VAEPTSAGGTSTANVMVTLSPGSAQTVTVQYATANGTAMGGASCTSGVAYQTTSGTLTFTPGQTSKSIAVTICSDGQAESNETLTVALSTPTGGSTLGVHATATVTLTNSVALLSAATADSYSVVAGTTLTVQASGVLSNDTGVGPPVGTLTAEVVSQPSHGILSLATNGGFTYTPIAGYAGPDAFSYRDSDGTYVTPPVTVSLTVTPSSCAPRPRVIVSQVVSGGQLQVTVQASALGTGGANVLTEIDFGQLKNAQVTRNGQQIANGQVLILSPGTTSASFVVQRATPGQAVTVPFTVKNLCGEWKSFVGAGAGAGF
jgi:Calx-beta domain-containing protein